MQSVSCKSEDYAYLHFLTVSPGQYLKLLQLLENLVFVEFPRFLYYSSSRFQKRNTVVGSDTARNLHNYIISFILVL